MGERRLAEGEGFEPPDLSVNGFQDRRLKPLGHPSIRRFIVPPPDVFRLWQPSILGGPLSVEKWGGVGIFSPGYWG